MSEPTRFYLVVPTADEIIAANGVVTVAVFNTLVEAQTNAVKAAITAGKFRLVMTATHFADHTVSSAAQTAQLETFTT